MNNDLSGKVAVVTGAGRGIGRAIAIGFAAAGAAVCCAARTQDEIDDVVQCIRDVYGTAIAIATDVTEPTDVDKMLQQTIDTYGRLDILVLNAGVQLDRGRVEESEPDAWWETVRVNLFGPYYCAKAAIPYLKESGAGKIITIGSGMGHRGAAGSSAYSVSKAGLWMFTRILAQEVAADNISVNELIPGPVNTSMTSNDNARSGVAFTTGSEWVKEPNDVVPLAMWLATQPVVGPSAQSFSLMRRDK